MSLKMKLVSMISAFVLVIGMLLIGVFAVNQAQVDMGGSITFNADDVYARVTGNVTKAQVEPEVLDVTYSAYETEGNPTAWESLDLEFDSYATPIVISITVENLSTERSLTVNLTDALTSSVPNLGKELKRDNGAYTSGTNITLDPKDNGTSTTTFTITLSVLNPNQSLTNAQFDYDLNLYDENYKSPYDYFDFSDNGDGTVTLTDYYPNLSDSADVVIPSTVSRNAEGQWIEGDTFTVTAIAGASSSNGVFYNSGITSIELPSTLESIGDYAFYNCSGLTGELNLGECTSLTSIGVNAFYNCSSLTGELNLGKCTNLTSIGFAAFCVCSSLTSITLPSSLTSIGDHAFQGCSGLTSITLPDSITSMGDGAFVGCDKLTSVDLSNCTSLASIGDSAFTECSGLTSITLPSSLTRIGISAFGYCRALAEVYNYSSLTLTIGSEDNGRVAEYAKVVYNLSDGEEKPATRIQTIDNIQYYVYEDDFIALAPTSRDISSVNLASRTTEINQFAFRDCSGLTSITLPSSLTSIGNYAFYGCSGLTGTVTIPASVNEIGANPFRSCSNLDGIAVESENSSYYVEGNCLIEKSTKTLIKGFNNSTIPSDIKVIGDYAFATCRWFTSITLPSSLTRIGGYAFNGCTNLASVTFENTEGWKRSTSSDMSSSSSVNVTNPSTNATYLKNTYVNYYWQRG